MGGAHISAQTLLFTIIWTTLCRSSHGQHCGHPGKPDFSKFDPSDVYDVGHRINYECIDGYQLYSPFRNYSEFASFGQRECLPDGTWDGGNVHCYSRLPEQKLRLEYQNQNIYQRYLPWASYTASDLLLITSIQLKDTSKLSVTSCGKRFDIAQPFNTSSALFRFPLDKINNTCRPLLDQGVLFTTSKWEELSVVPYRRNGLCGTPETPANGRLIRLNMTTVKLVCNTGYRLEGNEYRYCVDSFWDGTQVVCNKTAGENDSSQSNSHGSQMLHAGSFSISLVAIAISVLTLLILIGVVFFKCSKHNNRRSPQISERAPSVIYMNTGIGATGSTEPNTYAEISVNSALHANNIYERVDESSNSQLVEALYAQPTKKNQRNK